MASFTAASVCVWDRDLLPPVPYPVMGLGLVLVVIVLVVGVLALVTVPVALTLTLTKSEAEAEACGLADFDLRTRGISLVIYILSYQTYDPSSYELIILLSSGFEYQVLQTVLQPPSRSVSVVVFSRLAEVATGDECHRAREQP